MRGTSLGIRWEEQTWLMDLDLADDIALLSETRSKLQEITTNLEDTAQKMDLRISTVKTKTMPDWHPLQCDN